jgi:hypothetical protein
MDTIVQPPHPAAAAATATLRPRLASVTAAREYLGGISRSGFYDRYLPRLDIVRVGGRTTVTVESLDRLIDELRREAAAPAKAAGKGR